MESYDKLTLKSWLSALSDKELTFQFAHAVKRQDIPMVSLSIEELADRKIYHFIKYILDDYVIKHTTEFSPDFSAALKEFLVTYCMNDPLIVYYCNYIIATGEWPATQSDLDNAPLLVKNSFYKTLDATIAQLKAKYSDEPRIYPAICFGIQHYDYVLNDFCHEQIWRDTGDCACLHIESGEVKNEEAIPKAMSILYRKNIPTPLPPIDSLDPSRNYTPENETWRPLFDGEKDFFYVRIIEFKTPYTPPVYLA